MYQIIPQQAQQEYKLQKKRVRRRAAAIGVFLMLFVIFDIAFPFILEYVMSLPGVKETLRAFMTNNIYSSCLQILYTSIGMGIPVVIGMICLRMPPRIITPAKHVPSSVMMPLLLFGMGITRLANQAAAQVGTLVESFGLSQEHGDSTMGDNLLEIGLATIAISVIPAIFEELLFRGLVLQGMRRATSDSFAIFFSALLFGIFHGNIIQVPFAFILGLYFAWMTVYSNSIIPAMILHFLNNFISCAVSALFENLPGYELTINAVYCIVFLLLIVISLPLMARLARREKNLFSIAPNSTVLPTAQMWKSSICNVGIIVVFIAYGIQTVLLLFQEYIK